MGAAMLQVEFPKFRNVGYRVNQRMMGKVQGEIECLRWPTSMAVSMACTDR